MKDVQCLSKSYSTLIGIQQINPLVYSSKDLYGLQCLVSVHKMIAELLRAPTLGQRQLNMQEQYLRVHAPYCLYRFGDGLALPMNRGYKPLGLLESALGEFDDLVSYHKYDFLAIPEHELDLNWGIENCFYRKHPDYYFFLYVDNCAPWRAKKELENYRYRLARLVVRPLRQEHEVNLPTKGDSRLGPQPDPQKVASMAQK